MNQKENALECFDKAILINSNCVDAYYCKVDILLGNNEKSTDVLNCYNIILKIDPINSIVLNNKGCLLCELGDYDHALECVNDSLKLNPKDSKALQSKGHILIKLGKVEESSKYFCGSTAAAMKPFVCTL